MQRKKWREELAPLVSAVIAEVGMKDPDLLRAALRKAYPYDDRLGYRYRAWLAEITLQIGGMRPKKPHPSQLSLFD